MKLLAGEPDPSATDFNLLPTLRDLIQHHWEADTIFVDPSLPGGAVRAPVLRRPATGLVAGSRRCSWARSVGVVKT